MSKPRIKSTINANPASTFNEWAAAVLGAYKPRCFEYEAAWADLAANRHTNKRESNGTIHGGGIGRNRG